MSEVAVGGSGFEFEGYPFQDLGFRLLIEVAGLTTKCIEGTGWGSAGCGSSTALVSCGLKGRWL